VCADEDLKRLRQVFVELLPMGVLLKRRHALGVMLVQQPAHDTVLMFSSRMGVVI
jgi:hypothetical protein